MGIQQEKRLSIYAECSTTRMLAGLAKIANQYSDRVVAITPRSRWFEHRHTLQKAIGKNRIVFIPQTVKNGHEDGEVVEFAHSVWKSKRSIVVDSDKKSSTLKGVLGVVERMSGIRKFQLVLVKENK